MSVAVCAWCKPKEEHQQVGLLSHGICLRHLRKMKLEAHGLTARRTRAASVSHAKLEAMLLPFD
jgi:hypothetical protein